MIEVHLVPGKSLAAISTWHFAESAEESGCLVLATTDSLDFSLAICRVVPDVRRSLIAQLGHAQE